MSGCVHRWRLEEQNGTPFVMGTCGLCGATRRYHATDPSDRREIFISREHVAARQRGSARGGATMRQRSVEAD